MLVQEEFPFTSAMAFPTRRLSTHFCVSEISFLNTADEDGWGSSSTFTVFTVHDLPFVRFIVSIFVNPEIQVKTK